MNGAFLKNVKEALVSVGLCRVLGWWSEVPVNGGAWDGALGEGMCTGSEQLR